MARTHSSDPSYPGIAKTLTRHRYDCYPCPIYPRRLDHWKSSRQCSWRMEKAPSEASQGCGTRGALGGQQQRVSGRGRRHVENPRDQGVIPCIFRWILFYPSKVVWVRFIANHEESFVLGNIRVIAAHPANLIRMFLSWRDSLESLLRASMGCFGTWQKDLPIRAFHFLFIPSSLRLFELPLRYIAFMVYTYMIKFFSTFLFYVSESIWVFWKIWKKEFLHWKFHEPSEIST